MFVRRASRGFSLLELLVAISILGLSLGALLRSTTTATRNVATDERYVYAVELSKSLLAQYSQVPRDGFANTGETSGGFRWSVDARPLARGQASALGPGALQDIRVAVSWRDGNRERRVQLASVVPGE
ncbi:MAG: prepilin-type N-terminal cleavage/methylation domain-containing protein [Pseudomonadota bacterium]